MKISTKDLRTQVAKMLDVVERGEEVIITYRGKPRARVIAINEEKAVYQNTLFGIWRDKEDVVDVENYIDQLRCSR